MFVAKTLREKNHLIFYHLIFFRRSLWLLKRVSNVRKLSQKNAKMNFAKGSKKCKILGINMRQCCEKNQKHSHKIRNFREPISPFRWKLYFCIVLPWLKINKFYKLKNSLLKVKNCRNSNLLSMNWFLTDLRIFPLFNI